MDTGSFTKINKYFNDNKDISPTSFRLYAFLCMHLNKDKNGDMVFPSYTYINKHIGYGSARIRRAIIELTKLGWIKSIDKGFNKVNKYHLSTSANEVLENQKLSTSKMKVLEEGDSTSNMKVLPKRKLSTSKTKVEVLPKRKSNNTNITRLNNKTNKETTVFETPGVSQPEVNFEDFTKKEDIHTVIEELFPIHAESASIGNKLDNLIDMDIENDSSNRKAVTALINRDEIEKNENEALEAETENQRKFLRKFSIERFKSIEDKQLFRKIEKHLVDEALIMLIVRSKTMNYENLLNELEEYIPEFFRYRNPHS